MTSSQQPDVGPLKRWWTVVAVRGELIQAVGARADVLRLRGGNTRIVELGTQALLPGFIDSHGHFTAVAALIDQANLAPPPGGWSALATTIPCWPRSDIPTGTTLMPFRPRTEST